MVTKNKYGCVSKETAEALKRAGFHFMVNLHYDNKGDICEMLDSGETLYLGSGKWGISCLSGESYTPAPNIDNILEIIPKVVTYEDEDYKLGISLIDGECFLGYNYEYEPSIALVFDDFKIIQSSTGNGLAEAAAELLLDLKQYRLLPE